MAERRHVCALDELGLGRTHTAQTSRGPVVVVRTRSGVYALTDACTHADIALSQGFVDIDNDTIECPGHFAEFCLRTGRALTMPATEDVRAHTVHLVDGQIHLIQE
ncbi:Rieske 2Fe-2S domain-containing protein [Allokutzneria sp. A3M-2-11 16]|uniref:Rieske 2Fe-2S domain-containing protein n=1 Tax=Allokutzneria sp. A3M-2-11 16 TaxID=2962043 RepID=UPI0020B6B99F|nr:Rieske 2Fe-2S domain-containing protein [Allokutzneria sp. A3M-2-11 16]MCP3805016.1 Rieske 2Fe-2S domain-containing protein [Allokutzneria sp. A3M-2-11 16]